MLNNIILCYIPVNSNLLVLNYRFLNNISCTICRLNKHALRGVISHFGIEQIRNIGYEIISKIFLYLDP